MPTQRPAGGREGRRKGQSELAPREHAWSWANVGACVSPCGPPKRTQNPPASTHTGTRTHPYATCIPGVPFWASDPDLST
jgi:hypothetical protein